MRHCLSLFLAFVLCVTSGASAAAEKDADPVPRVLVLHSYDPQYPWTRQVMAGMLEAFNARERQVSLHVEYFDTKRFHDPEYLDGFLVETMRYKLRGMTFDLVLVSDNDALNFLLSHRQELFPGVPAVFCGINDFNAAMLEGVRGVTGVAERPSFQATVETALRLHPDTQELIVVGGTDNRTDLINRRLLGELLPVVVADRPAHFWDDLPVEELRRRLADLPQNRVVFINATAFHDASGKPLLFTEVLQSLHRSSAAPMYSFWDFYLGQGIVGGALVSGREQGRQAGELALRVLGGESPDTFEIIEAEANPYLFDWRELVRFGIHESRLPHPHRLINKPSPFYELHTLTFWTGLVLMAVLAMLVTLLLYNFVSRRKTEKKLRRQTHFQQTILDAIPIPLYYKDLEGRYLGSNRAGEKFFGKSAQELTGRTVHEVFPEDFANFIEASDEALKEHGGIQTFSTQVRDGSGLLRNVIFYKSTFEKDRGRPGGIVGTMMDITDLKEAQHEIRDRERKYSALFETSLDGIVIVDRRGLFEDANRAFQEMVGYSLPELVGKNWRSLIAEPDRQRILDLFSKPLARRGFTDEIELEILRSDGNSFPGRLRTWADEEKRGRPRRFLTIIRDATEQKKVDRLKEEMLSMVSHEMRTPLTAMLGFTEFLMENDAMDLVQRRRSLQTIHDETLRLKELIDNLLNLQRIRSGREVYHFVPLYLTPILMESARLFDRASEKHRITLEIDEELPRVMADEGKVRQVLRNLLSNAIKYTPEGGTIHLGASRKESMVEIWVQDSGVGIEEEAIAQIFDSFYRVDNSDTRKIGGTGLGLALVREVVRAHAGEVQVESSPGQGSRFSVTLPQASVQEAL